MQTPFGIVIAVCLIRNCCVLGVGPLYAKRKQDISPPIYWGKGGRVLLPLPLPRRWGFGWHGIRVPGLLRGAVCYQLRNSNLDV